jgi:hypothetical protein
LQIEAAADTAVVLQISVRLTRYCPCLAVRFPPQPETGDGCQSQISLRCLQAADGGRTRDLKLGKLALYQLSYHRVAVNLTTFAIYPSELCDAVSRQS